MELRRRGHFALLLWAMTLAMAVTAQAQTLIRDAGLERALSEIAKPLITAAGLSPGRVKVLIIQDQRLNAFVVNERAVFLHSGLILKADRVEELQAVIAHELAHIANGHISRRMANLQSSRTAAGLGMALALATAAAGGGRAAAGIGLGTASAAQRSFFAHTRAEEASADQAALRYMMAAGVDPRAMADVLDLFRGQEALSPGRQDPYVHTHPLTRDRIRTVKGLAAAAGETSRKNQTAEYWFLRAQSKLGAFTGNPSRVLRQGNRGDTSEFAVLRRAIANHRLPKPDAAKAQIDALVAARPDDPYYHDLRGQIYLESRDFAGAVSAYNRAVALAPKHPQILAGYGRALLAAGGNAPNPKALTVLERARDRDARDPRLLRDLAVAYARAGQGGMASLATAERYALIGQAETAALHAERAMAQLPRGSTGWRRADDILHSAKSVAQ